jgi:hypothetical protein
MNPKMMIRKKAMDMEMRMKPEMPIKKRSAMQVEVEPQEMTSDDQQQEGYEAVMLSPEEKQMILAMRKKMGVGGAEESAEPQEMMME